MNSIVYVGMDVHKESYTVCCYSFDTDEVMYKQKMAADYKLILKYVEQLRRDFQMIQNSSADMRQDALDIHFIISLWIMA